MQLVPGTETPFGNNGSAGYHSAVTSASNTALADLSNRSAVLSALTTATDHLPLVADYAFVGLPGDANYDGIVNGQDISLVASNWEVTGAKVPGDVNGDGIVNGQDISLIASHWEQTSTGGSGACSPRAWRFAAGRHGVGSMGRRCARPH